MELLTEDKIRLDTPVGTMEACANEQGISRLEFIGEDRSDDTHHKVNVTLVQGESIYFDQLERELNEYFNGKRQEFTIPLCMGGSVFQKQVWEELLQIPYGETRSYLEQSLAIGKPTAVRAVAAANGMNRIAIIIPCHRVIGSNGKLTGYNGGLWRKKYLLDLEKGEYNLNN